MNRQEFLSWANIHLATQLERKLNKTGSNCARYAMGVPGLRIAVRANVPPDGVVSVQLLADDPRHTRRWHAIKANLFRRSGATGLRSRLGKSYSWRYLEFSWPVEDPEGYESLQGKTEWAIGFFLDARNSGALSPEVE